MNEATDVTVNRGRGIGGSEIAAIMGISPFTNRFDLLQYKLGYKENDFKGNEFTEYGKIMEPKIRDYINDMWDANFVPDYIETDTDKPLSLFYHSDGHDDKRMATLEIKTTSQVASMFDAMDKGISFDDYEWKFYEKYYVQAVYGAMLHHDKEVWLAVYDRPDDMSTEFDSTRLFISRWEFDKDKFDDTDYVMSLWERIQDAIRQFRIDYDYMEEHPSASEPDLPSRSPMIPIANKVLALEDKIEYAQQIIKEYDALKKSLCEKMQENNIKSWIMPNGTKVTLVPKGESKTVKVFDEKKFAEEHGDLYEQYTRDKVKEGRSAYVRLTAMAKGEEA